MNMAALLFICCLVFHIAAEESTRCVLQLFSFCKLLLLAMQPFCLTKEHRLNVVSLFPFLSSTKSNSSSA